MKMKKYFYMALIVIIVFTMGTQAQIGGINNTFTGGKTMAELWDLDTPLENNTFTITPYRPLYFVFGRYSSNINKSPESVNLDNAPESAIPYDDVETSFQLSFKTKVFHDVLWGTADVWLAYTQEAYYQLYNQTISRPMRELNYEPEVILNFKTDFKLFGFRARMFGLSINHESNGLDLPRSRSWNRIIFHAGFERKNWQIYVRPWVYVPRSRQNNPKIEDYVGRGELRIIRDFGKHRLTFIGKHDLNPAEGRGSARLDYTFPIANSLNGYLRIFSGYGESLIDYNHFQRTVGLGISFID